MGTSSSKRALSTEHKQALSAYSQEQIKEMKQAYASVMGSESAPIQRNQLPKLLSLQIDSSGAYDCLDRALTYIHAASSGKTKKAASQSTQPGLPDLVLLKYNLERASKQCKCQAVLSMLPHDMSAQVLLDSIISVLKTTCPSATDPASRLHLRHIATSLAPHTGDFNSFQAATKAWPGLLRLFASLTTSFPHPPKPHSPISPDIADTATAPDACVPAHIAAPQIANPPESSAASHLLLSEAARLALASLLPSPQQCKWHLLFNSDLNGKSFASFYGRITSQGPSIIVVRDKNGHVFGGYASEPWEKHGTFYGSASSFLFQLEPTFAVHFASNVNTNFQWCGRQFSQLPNGIGFGGQVGYFSLLINDDLDSGMSRPAATFAAPCLASAEVFEIERVECWLVLREEGEDGPAGPAGTALDRFKEDKHILELHGQHMHSDGYRDRPPSPK